MTTFANSPYYIGSTVGGPGIWIRDPVIDGLTPITRAMDLLDQARKEVQAIQNILGTDVAGSATDLATRLSKRLSPAGIGRGRALPLRSANTVAGTFEPVAGWYTGKTLFYQFGKSAQTSGVSTVTITYTQAYFPGFEPKIVIAKYVANSAHPDVGAAQLDKTSITDTQFDVTVQGWRSDASWGQPDRSFNILWIAIGGIPLA